MPQETTPPSPPPQQQPPSNQDPDPLLTTIRRVVTTANAALSSFEQSTTTTTSTLISRLHALSHQGRLIASRAVSAYDKRGYYGPQICVGSALLVGSLVGLRSGKGLGMVAGGLGGLMAYENVYGFDSGMGEGWRDKLRRAGS